MEEVTSELVAAARKGKRDALIELLAIHYPVVWRMATGLTGRADVGAGVAKFVMQRSLRVASNWKEEGAPTRWFHHHTVLTTRRTHKHPPDSSSDTFLRSGKDDAPYVAFIRALRLLPAQQREAFILSFGEKFGSRQLAIAMDCSIVAAENHLREASERLRELAAGQFQRHVAQMVSAYQNLGPDQELVLKDVRRRVSKWVLPWYIGRIIKTILSLVVFAAALIGAYWIWQIVRHSLQE